ncbi:hypothetical protein EYC98_15625 [Halieaceae bacterium IMCC14734]|uniref:PepSY domain-containing protein n=1 Tax=Candidatus Litorirhabdus singularis TaxID=2518993 RepID=A0ABT3TLS7_9GAMM|nr:hypothetical protein [Candidatus Litorirhabdus singularis]MCX2982292.1 hypothetical protein [Candidatus Litorirhabdus singularis]
MLMLRRPETGPLSRTFYQRAVTDIARILLWLALGLAVIIPATAQVGQAQRAIEKLEGCSKQERTQGCINILLSRPAGENRQAIKAQVRGGRIIWYEFDSKKGKVRRTN